ncbi:MAG: 4-hydroxythreonine-4-phosphate dehydrogenase PdxA [Betaproteobacteria bacterium]
MGSRLPVIALTSGEPAGIGPDLALALARAQFPARIVVIGDAAMLEARARTLGMQLSLRPYSAAAPLTDAVEVEHVPAARDVRPGHLDPANSAYVLATLDRAIDGCLTGEFDAMVTAPVHKGVINDAGMPFTGHTEYLAQRTGTDHVVMMLVGGGLRVALATTHLALADVPRAITRASLTATLRVIAASLAGQFGITSPRILVSGLNPHSGESGHLGREEIEVIEPVIAALKLEGMALEGPVPADTLFVPERLKRADCALAMFHDQGLPVLKFASFGQGVNVTLGLPIVRTSVDHGTALDLAGTGRAEAGSLAEAVRLALGMARNGVHAG